MKSHPRSILTSVLLASLTVLGATERADADAQAATLRPRPESIKPLRTRPTAHDAVDVISVKFRDDLVVRLRDGALTDLGSGALAEAAPMLALVADRAAGARWERRHQLDEAKLAELRQRAQSRLGRVTADLNSEYLLWLPGVADVGATIDALNALDVVEIAQPIGLPVPPPLPPNYIGFQGYLNPAPGGVDAQFAWNTFGNRGAGVKFADCEYLFNPSHVDLPPVTILGPTPQDAGFGNAHGTAVLGVVAGVNQGWGVSGICSDSTFYFAGTYTSGVVNIAAAITNCLGTFGDGDVIILEAQMAGPNYSGGSDQFGLVPVEWALDTYNAVVTAIGNGVIVLAAAGNGQQDLDAPLYSQGNGGHWPFLAANDSGSIIVGAGAVPGGSSTDRSRLWYSNYGSTVDVQGWGENVCTTGYGSLYSAEGANSYYTKTFGGTSSATPTAGGACALIQSIHKVATGTVIAPDLLRQALIDTGSPQQSGGYPASQHIGPRPDIEAALDLLGLLCVSDLSGDGSVDGADLGALIAAWGACPGCEADLDHSGTVDAADLGVLLGAWGPC